MSPEPEPRPSAAANAAWPPNTDAAVAAAAIDRAEACGVLDSNLIADLVDRLSCVASAWGMPPSRGVVANGVIACTVPHITSVLLAAPCNSSSGHASQSRFINRIDT